METPNEHAGPTCFKLPAPAVDGELCRGCEAEIDATLSHAYSAGRDAGYSSVSYYDATEAFRDGWNDALDADAPPMWYERPEAIQ